MSYGLQLDFDRVDPNGKFVRLRNPYDNRVDISGWSVHQVVNTVNCPEYVFQPGTFLNEKEAITVYSADAEMQPNSSELAVRAKHNWGKGGIITTMIVNHKRKFMIGLPNNEYE